MSSRRLKNIYLFLCPFIAGILFFSFASAKSAEKEARNFWFTNSDTTDNLSHSGPSVMEVYDSIHESITGLSKRAFELAEMGFSKLRDRGAIQNDSIISIIDFSMSSTQKRLFVIDLKNYRVLFNTYVAHGRNSGKEFARSFSNYPRSNKSSLGFYITGQTYRGKHGYSLRLSGTERGINDNAMRRAVVLHGANYVSEDYINSQGYIGRSLGCPAVSLEESEDIINAIKEGTCLFIFYPDQKYISHSRYLN